MLVVSCCLVIYHVRLAILHFFVSKKTDGFRILFNVLIQFFYHSNHCFVIYYTNISKIVTYFQTLKFCQNLGGFL